MDLDRVRETLANKLGMTSLKGFDCLVWIVILNIDSYYQGFKYSTIGFYKEVGLRMQCPAYQVERAIRYYRETLEENIDLQALFGVKIGKRYPNREFINNVMNMLKKEGVFNG